MNPIFCYSAYVYNVVDGDTVDAEVDVGFKLTAKLRFRLLGIDAPEKRGPSRGAGLVATEWMKDKVLGKKVVIETAKGDSFGRWLATIYLDGENINELMIREGQAVPYRR